MINAIRRGKGITLIALVITIIILLILAAISISALTDSGLFGKAKQAKAETERQEAKEQVQLAVLASYGEDGKLDYGQLRDNLSKIIGIKNLPDSIENLPITVNVKGYDVTIQEDETVTVSGEKTDTGSGEENPNPPVTETKTVEDLKAGEYVNYVDKDGNKIPCVVLYDSEYNATNGTNYGVQIITTDAVDSVTIGNGTGEIKTKDMEYFNIAKKSYNEAIDTLYYVSNKYLNSDYAISARPYGSHPEYYGWDTEEMFPHEDFGFGEYELTLKYSSSGEHPESPDLKRARDLNIDNVKCWYAERVAGYDAGDGAHCWIYDKDRGWAPLITVYKDGSNWTTSRI